MTTKTDKKASQNIVPIKEIKDGVIVLKDDSLRTVLMTSSLNFSLKSDEEQTGIIIQYQNFLNSLDFSLQFFIQSRNINIEPYLEIITKRRKEEVNDLLKVQMKEYTEFIREFVDITKIVSKNFYIVVPYSPTILESGGSSVLKSLGAFFKKTPDSLDASQEKFEEHKNQLQQRANAITQSLPRFGIEGIPLNTEELIELFYSLYNPDDTEQPSLPEFKNTNN